MEANQRNFSILMFPWLAHGHVFPYLELAKNLAKKNFNIYFCSTAINLTSIKDSLENISNIELVELHLPSFPDLPPHYHTTKNVPKKLYPILFEAFHMSKSSFSEIMSTLKPDLLIYDVFQTWSAKQALTLGIPAVHFATTGATAYSFYYHAFKHTDLPFPYQEIYMRDHERKAMKELNMSSTLDKEDRDSAFIHFLLSCELVLIKSTKGIEGKYIDYFSSMFGKNLVPVGSLVGQPYFDDSDNHSKILEWMGKRNTCSTVYISFGSENFLSRKQMEEIAKGLELCDVNFIWVVRFPIGEEIELYEALPMGFLEKVKDRGLVVERWAPQAEILAHPSVGAFVSHCGMSSIFESIYFGVPIVAIPLKLDQPLNARLVVEAGVGIEVVKDNDGNLGREEVVNAINEVLLRKRGEELRIKAAELSKKMKIEEEEAMNEAAEQLRRLCAKYKRRSDV